jgi:hypothetical protein
MSLSHIVFSGRVMIGLLDYREGYLVSVKNWFS